ncbi:hypothetical protein GEMRC1_009592 [Eukaryota sp. GEM-RC1]
MSNSSNSRPSSRTSNNAKSPPSKRPRGLDSLDLAHTYCFPSDCFCNNLYSLQRDNLLTDAVITYDGNPFHCHSFVVSAFSPILKEKGLESTTLEFHLIPFLTDSDIFFSVLSTLYGQSLIVTPENVTYISVIASLLQFQELSQFVTERMTKGLGNFGDNNFKLDSQNLILKIVESCPKDVRVSYKNTSITLNSVLLISFSKMFQNLITCEFKDSAVRNFEYSDEFPGVSDEVFGLFFGLIHYENSVEFSISNILEFFQLSVYFQVDQLKLDCKNFLVSNSFQEKNFFIF